MDEIVAQLFYSVCSSDLVCAQLAAGSPTVGVYYYPWYGAGPGTPGHTFNDTLRAHLTPEKQLPAAGAKSSRDANVIAAHIDQSHLGNISMWSMSWWGPNGYEDRTIRQNILTHPRAAELKYTIHYESVGRFGNDFANPNFNNFLPDFRYLAQNIWSDPNYMRIDGRPVVIMYLTREYFKTEGSWEVLSDVRDAIEQEFGYNPYIIGDDFFGTGAVNQVCCSIRCDYQLRRLWYGLQRWTGHAIARQCLGEYQSQSETGGGIGRRRLRPHGLSGLQRPGRAPQQHADATLSRRTRSHGRRIALGSGTGGRGVAIHRSGRERPVHDQLVQ